MSLKDLIARDIDAVFFNLDEIAQTAIIDGVPVPISQDDDRITEKADISALGSTLGEILIFVKEKDLPRAPLGGEQINVNGKNWYVRSAISNMGVFEIRLGRDRLYA
jgi:hypothetical protein